MLRERSSVQTTNPEFVVTTVSVPQVDEVPPDVLEQQKQFHAFVQQQSYIPQQYSTAPNTAPLYYHPQSYVQDPKNVEIPLENLPPSYANVPAPYSVPSPYNPSYEPSAPSPEEK